MLELNGCKNFSISSANSFRDDRFVFCRSPGIEMFQTGFSQRVLNTVWASYRYNLLSNLRNTSMHLAF